MYQEINRQMEEAQQNVFRFRKINTMLEELHRQKKALESKVAELKGILDKEDTDVEKLEGKSLAHIFHSVLGNLDEQIQKEQQEALAARLKYEQTVRELESVEYEIAKLEEERNQYVGSEKLYQELYSRKKEMLLNSNSETAQKIMDLTEQINATKNMMQEIREAINAGSNAMNHVNNALSSLNDAEGWGTWDLFGGGLLSDMMKHSHIDDAKSEAEHTQIALMRFRTELADVKINSSINIDTDGFGKFADFFFDGLIADWCMQSRIHDSQASVENVKGQVETVMARLSTMEVELTTHVEMLKNEINTIIQNA